MESVPIIIIQGGSLADSLLSKDWTPRMVFLQGKDFPAECRFFMRRKACDGRSADERGPGIARICAKGDRMEAIKGS